MDGGLLANRDVPDQPDGRVHWTCGGKPDLWFAFFWWDRSVDTRGGCNSGFYVRGFEPGKIWVTDAGEDARLVFDRAELPKAALAAFEFACSTWPSVVARQLHKLVLQPPVSG